MLYNRETRRFLIAQYFSGGDQNGRYSRLDQIIYAVRWWEKHLLGKKVIYMK